MPVMSDRWIRRMAQDHGMIEPFVEAQKRQGVISYGLSSYGYDAPSHALSVPLVVETAAAQNWEEAH